MGRQNTQPRACCGKLCRNARGFTYLVTCYNDINLTKAAQATMKYLLNLTMII